MRCTACQQAEYTKSRGDQDYLAGIDGITVTLLNVERFDCPKCGDHSFTIPRMAALHRDLEAARNTRKHHSRHVHATWNEGDRSWGIVFTSRGAP